MKLKEPEDASMAACIWECLKSDSMQLWLDHPNPPQQTTQDFYSVFVRLKCERSSLVPHLSAEVTRNQPGSFADAN